VLCLLSRLGSPNEPTSNIRVVASPGEMRAIARRGQWRDSTGGQCPAYQQANLVILPKEAAAEFAAFCTRNPKPCPLIEITPPATRSPPVRPRVRTSAPICPAIASIAAVSWSKNEEKSVTSGAATS